jgi:hypothetical protein
MTDRLAVEQRAAPVGFAPGAWWDRRIVSADVRRHHERATNILCDNGNGRHRCLREGAARLPRQLGAHAGRLVLGRPHALQELARERVRRLARRLQEARRQLARALQPFCSAVSCTSPTRSIRRCWPRCRPARRSRITSFTTPASRASASCRPPTRCPRSFARRSAPRARRSPWPAATSALDELPRYRAGSLVQRRHPRWRLRPVGAERAAAAPLSS